MTPKKDFAYCLCAISSFKLTRTMNGNGSGQYSQICISPPTCDYGRLCSISASLMSFMLRKATIHAFYPSDKIPSEQMFKKRIRKWNLARNMRASDKNEAILKHYEGLPPELVDESTPSRANKILRYARTQAKLGRVSEESLQHLSREYRKLRRAAKEASNSVCNSDSVSGSQQGLLPSSRHCPLLSLPDDLADRAIVLRMLQNCNAVFVTGSICETSLYGQDISDLLSDGYEAWKMPSFLQARDRFDSAAVTLLNKLRHGVIPALEIINLVHPQRDGLECPIFKAFARFSSDALDQVLGNNHPFALLVQFLRKPKMNGKHLLAIYDYVLSSCPLSADNYEVWCRAAEWCVLALEESAMIGFATQRCKDVLYKLEQSGLLTHKYRAVFTYRLAKCAYAQLDIDGAASAAKQVLDLTKADLGRWAWVRRACHRILAEMYRFDYHDLQQARWHYTEAWNIARYHLGYNHPMTARAFKHLVSFHSAHSHPNDLEAILEEHATFYEQLDELTEGHWRGKSKEDQSQSRDTTAATSEPFEIIEL